MPPKESKESRIMVHRPKKGNKLSNKELLASVTKEMKRPRIAPSAQGGHDKHGTVRLKKPA